MSANDTNFQAFPQMVYHPVEGQKIINTETELKEHLARGWYDNFEKFSSIDSRQKKIEYHQSELDRLKREQQISRDPSYTYIPVANATSHAMPIFKKDEETIPDKEPKKGPGRPAKKVQ